jgi:glycosyltransferase involved in cell wall biosynthesis
MSIDHPLVSIGLPVYNGEKYVAEAIACVLAQTFTNWELIISDNASSDGTVAVCRAYAAKDDRIRVVNNERNLGVTANYNRVFELATGKYFKWIAHDDLFDSTFVQSCVDELERDPDAVMAFPTLVHIDADGRVLRRQDTRLAVDSDSAAARVKRLIDLEIAGTDIYWSQFGVLRRSAVAATHVMGPYSASDQVLLLELALRGKLKEARGATFQRREHPGASTLRGGWTARERALFAYADDRRRFVFPYCRLLQEHIRAVWRAPVSVVVKIWCSVSVCRRFLHHWKDFVLEISSNAASMAAKKPSAHSA